MVVQSRDEQQTELSKIKQTLYYYVENLELFQSHFYQYDGEVAIHDFRVRKLVGRKFFSFQMNKDSFGDFNQAASYYIKGSVISNDNVQDYSFHVVNLCQGPHQETNYDYSSRVTKINEAISLHEIFSMNMKRCTILVLEVYLIVDGMNELSIREREKIKIPVDCDIYKMYQKRQIDAIAFSHLAIEQGSFYPVYNEQGYKMRLLSKNYHFSETN